LNVDDTFRGISWNQKAFTPTSMTWNYDAQNNLLLPSVSLAEVTQGNAGQTIAIPLEPPDAGYKQPPIQLPPPMPSFPVPPIDWGFSGYEFVPAIYNTDNSYVGFYGYVHSLDANSQAQGGHITNPGYSGAIIIVYPIIAVSSASDGNLPYVIRCEYSPVDGPGWTYSTTTPATTPWTIYTVSGSPGAFTIPGLSLENNASGNWQLQFYFDRKGADASDTVDDNVICIGWLVAYL